MASETEQAWLFAAKVGEAAQLQQLLAAEPHLLAFAGAGTPDQVIGNTATHWAASKGHVEALEVLLRAGADVHARNNGDSTPLHCAALSNQLDCANVLLQHGADATLQDEFGDSPLSLAQRADGRDALVALLLGKRGSVAAAPSPSAAECRQRGNEAFKAERYEEALGLYEEALTLTAASAPAVAGAEAEAAVAAEAALRSNRSACFAALRRFEPALTEAQQACALRPSWAKGHSRVGAALHGLGRLEEAAAAYAQALSLEPHNTQAEQASARIKRERRDARLEALIERGAFNKRGAAEAGAPAGAPAGAAGAARPAKVERSAEHLAYCATVKEWHGAAKTGQLASLARLLDAEPWLLQNRSENAAEQQLGNTALHWAAAHGQAAAVEWLLKQPGVQVDARNHGGGTPLHSAAAHGRAAVLEQLLQAGADATLLDEGGESARAAAARRGYRSAEAVIDRGPLLPAVRWAAQGGPARAAGAAGGGAAGGRPARPADAEAAKAAGNAAFAAGGAELPRAVWHYTDALLLGHTEAAAIESNRSAAHAKLGQFHAALEDADAAVARRPEWGKAHGRRGAALHGLREWARSEAAYLEGLTHEPDSAQLQQGLEEARKAAAP